MGKISGSDLKSLGVLMDGHTPINLPAGGVPSAASHALIHWILDYPAELEGYGFPFDRPHLALYQRIQTAFELLEKMVPPPCLLQDKNGESCKLKFRKLQLEIP